MIFDKYISLIRRFTLSISFIQIALTAGQSDTSALCFQFRYSPFKGQLPLSYPGKPDDRCRNCIAD